MTAHRRATMILWLACAAVCAATAARGHELSAPEVGGGDWMPDDLDASADTDPYVPPPGVRLRAETVIAHWEDDPARLARQMMKRYGPPDAVTPRALYWHHRSPWARVVVRQDAAVHRFPAPHNDWLEETVSYAVPVAKFGDLAAFDGSLLADRTRRELTARGDSEASNILALNLAAEIATGRASAAQARQTFARLCAKGLSSSPLARALRLAADDSQ